VHSGQHTSPGCCWGSELLLSRRQQVSSAELVLGYKSALPGDFQKPSPPMQSRVGIHKRFGARKKTGSEPIFLRIDFKFSFLPFLQMLFTEKVSVLEDFFKKIDLFEKD
jgi:hypothetical protein